MFILMFFGVPISIGCSGILTWTFFSKPLYLSFSFYCLFWSIASRCFFFCSVFYLSTWSIFSAWGSVSVMIWIIYPSVMFRFLEFSNILRISILMSSGHFSILLTILLKTILERQQGGSFHFKVFSLIFPYWASSIASSIKKDYFQFYMRVLIMSSRRIRPEDQISAGLWYSSRLYISWDM